MSKKPLSTFPKLKFTPEQVLEMKRRREEEQRDAENTVNLKEWILNAAAPEPILAIVMGEMMFDSGYGSPIHELITWKEAEPLLDCEVNTGYGGEMIDGIIAWTETKIIVISDYDSSSDIHVLPRNPCEFQPYRIGAQ